MPSAQPANIEIISDPFDEDLVKSVRDIPGVLDAEGRHMLTVRVSQDGKSWQPLDIVAPDDFRTASINLLTPDEGTIYAEDRQLMVREDIMNSTGYQPGTTCWCSWLTAPYANCLSSARWATSMRRAISPRRRAATSRWIRPSGSADMSSSIVSTCAWKKAMMTRQLTPSPWKWKKKWSESGRRVYRTNTNKTTEHPLESMVLAIVGVLAALGVLIMLLSSSLIFNTLNALLTQHRRQIGVMKLVGGRSTQILLMYMALILIYGFLALIIAVPLGVVAGYRLATFMGEQDEH